MCLSVRRKRPSIAIDKPHAVMENVSIHRNAGVTVYGTSCRRSPFVADVGVSSAKTREATKRGIVSSGT